MSCLWYTYNTEEHCVLCRVVRHAEDRELRPTRMTEKRILYLKLEGRGVALQSGFWWMWPTCVAAWQQCLCCCWNPAGGGSGPWHSTTCCRAQHMQDVHAPAWTQSYHCHDLQEKWDTKLLNIQKHLISKHISTDANEGILWQWIYRFLHKTNEVDIFQNLWLC